MKKVFPVMFEFDLDTFEDKKLTPCYVAETIKKAKLTIKGVTVKVGNPIYLDKNNQPIT